MEEHTTCWCGYKELVEYSPLYNRCTNCGTLVLKYWPDGDVTAVQDEGELYSRDYYLKHLPNEYGYPSLEHRARTDLSERVMFWMQTLLQYKLPPSRVLELGSAHGGFVAMLHQAGFEASGLELSPWLVEYSKEIFEIPVYQGALEQQKIQSGTLDAIALMDVLEHLPDPVATMQFACDLLKPDGMLLIQTPKYEEEKTFTEIQENQDPFLAQFKEKEHLFLFSPRSIKILFEKLGCEMVNFEPAIFSHYDMFVAIGKTLISRNSIDQVDSSLMKTPGGRIVQAFLDLYLADRARISLFHNQMQDMNSQLHDAHSQLERADTWLKNMGEELQYFRGAMQRIINDRFYKILRKLGLWAWMEETVEKLSTIK